MIRVYLFIIASFAGGILAEPCEPPRAYPVVDAAGNRNGVNGWQERRYIAAE
jgi:hypothetical protein